MKDGFGVKGNLWWCKISKSKPLIWRRSKRQLLLGLYQGYRNVHRNKRGQTLFEATYKLQKVSVPFYSNTEKIKVSEIEKTIIDCLYQPKYCGGILEIATGIRMQKENINYDKLIAYAIKFNKNIVIKRLGHILEILKLQSSESLNKLKTQINDKYYVLDPLLDTKETYKNSWKLIVNISPQEFEKTGTT
ncbi:MAG: hypothetical protein ISS26_04465 [Candidatus Omnitrophica bacterium]|nr:hypothetical protein [Candidatus Omnitrophota bacterium]